MNKANTRDRNHIVNIAAPLAQLSILPRTRLVHPAQLPSGIFCKDFQFPGGGVSDKLFIVLGVRPLQAVIAVTTSKAPKTAVQLGCTSQRSLFLLKRTAANKLDLDTYLLLTGERLGILNPAMMKEKRWQEAVVKFTLPEHDAHAIKNCAMYCEDVPFVYRGLLGPPPALKPN